VHRDVVFNANASDARYVNSWFDRNHVPWNQDVLLSTRHPWIFVHFQAESVSGAVHEIMVKAVARQNPSGGGVDISTPGAGLRSGYRGRLRFLDSAIPPPHAHRSASDEDSSRNITAIVAEYNTQVQYHQFIFPQAFFCGPRMRVCRTSAEGHYTFERRTRSSPAPHLIFNLGGDLDFAHTRLKQLEDARQHPPPSKAALRI
jgi:hypothetical protein